MTWFRCARPPRLVILNAPRLDQVSAAEAAEAVEGWGGYAIPEPVPGNPLVSVLLFFLPFFLLWCHVLFSALHHNVPRHCSVG